MRTLRWIACTSLCLLACRPAPDAPRTVAPTEPAWSAPATPPPTPPPPPPVPADDGWDLREGFSEEAPSPRTAEPEPAEPPPADSTPAGACCRMCSKGKACGNTCIARSKTCHVPRGCACDE